MAVSAFQKVLSRLFRQFTLRNGREPQTPKEWMDLQNEAVQLFNKTKGAPDIFRPQPKKPPFQGFKPRVIQGGKGIESLLKSGDVKKGVAPKTKLSTLEGKKQKLDTAISKEEWIAKKKAENKAAIERFKEKTQKKTAEDFRDEGDWDPSGMASGGRIGMAGGGALKKFIEQLFIKASNDIRLGRGKWKGLDQKQRIVQHDNLTKKVTEFQKSGKTVGLEEYFGVDPHTAFIGARDKVKRQGIIKDFPETAGKPKMSEFEFEAKKAAEGKPVIPLGGMDERTMLKQKYPGLTDDLLEKILIDDNPQRKAEVLATMDEFLKLKEIGKGEEEAFDIITKSFQKIPTKHGEGGRISNQSGGLAYMLGEPTYMKAGGGQVGHGPWTTGQTPPGPQPQPEMPQPQVQGQPNPMKMPQGIPSAAPRSMDPRVMQQQMMQRAMMGQQQRPRMQEGGTPEIPQEFLEDFKRKQYHELLDKYRRFQEDYERRKNLAPTQEAAGGGRIGLMYGGDPGFAFEYGGSWADWHDQHRNAMPIEDYIQTKLPKERLPFRDPAKTGGRIGFGLGGFNKARRAFLKMMAGITGAGIAGASGLLKFGKTAPKVIPKAAEVITRGPDGIPDYAWSLIEVVKAKGTKDIIEGLKKSDYSTVHSYKGVDVIEEANGTTRIKKQHESGGHYQTDEGGDEAFDGITHEVEMEIKPQYDEIMDESGATYYKDLDGRKHYEIKIPDEYAEYTARPDMDGKLKEVDEGIDDLDHLDLKEIADEIDTLHTQDHHKTIRRKKASGGLAYMLGE